MVDFIMIALWVVFLSVYAIFHESVRRNLKECKRLNDESLKNVEMAQRLVGGGGEMKKDGIYGKFIVTRTDGKSEKGGRHDGCSYFVLDLNHDPHAKAAIEAYAQSCKKDLPELARDLNIASLACPQMQNTGRHVEMVYPDAPVWEIVADLKDAGRK
jgi:hypothetical protein